MFFLTKLLPYQFRNYSLLKSHLKYIFGKKPILVYSMPKTGSITMARTLEEGGFFEVVFHTHFLTNNEVLRLQRLVDKNFYRKVYQEKIDKIKYLQSLVKTSKDKHWRLVVLVREPVIRAISEIFQNIPRELPNLSCQEELDKEGFKKLKNLFTQKKEYLYKTCLTWFDTQIKKNFGIDVFKSDFDKKKGYKIYRSKRAQLLLIRLEDLDRCYRKAFKEFFGREIDLVKANLSKDKSYYQVYKGFVRKILLSSRFINKMYSVKYVKHFYRKEEIEEFKRRWLKRI